MGKKNYTWIIISSDNGAVNYVYIYSNTEIYADLDMMEVSLYLN